MSADPSDTAPANSVRERVGRVWRWAERAATDPFAELDEQQRRVRMTLQACHRAWDSLLEDMVPRMAAALTYRTIFSLVPMLAIGLGLFKVIGGAERTSELVKTLLQYVGLDQIEVSRAGSEGTIALADFLSELINNVTDANFGAITAVGAVLLVYASISLFVELEQNMNQLVDAPRGRPWVKRIQQYWLTITVGPILLWASFTAGSRLQSGIVGLFGESTEPTGPVDGVSAVATFASEAVTLTTTWLLLVLAYKVIPHARVSLRSVLVGSFIAAVLWRIARALFGAYLNNFDAYANLYGSLALLPIALLWIYITWVVLLFGLKVSFTMDRFGDWRRASLAPMRSARALPDWGTGLAIAEMAAERFAAGEDLPRETLDDRLRLAPEHLDGLCAALVSEGVLRRVTAADGSGGDDPSEARYTLAAPASSIRCDAVLRATERVIRPSGNGPDGDGSAAAERVHRAAFREVGEQTLAEFVGGRKAGSADGRRADRA